MKRRKKTRARTTRLPRTMRNEVLKAVGRSGCHTRDRPEGRESLRRGGQEGETIEGIHCQSHSCHLQVWWSVVSGSMEALRRVSRSGA